MDEDSHRAKACSIVRLLQHKVKQTKNGGVYTDNDVKRVQEKVDGGVTADSLRCILLFTRRKLDDHLQSRTSIISCYLVGSCPNLVSLSYKRDDLRMF